MNHDKRLQNLRSRLDDALLVTDLANIRYLTGFTGSSAFLLVTTDGGTFFTDGRYGEVAGAVVDALTGVDLHVHTGPVTDDIAQHAGEATVGLEGHHVTWDFARRLGDAVTGEVKPTSGLVSDLRRVKDADEVETLRRAAAAGDAAFTRIQQLASSAGTEADLGRALISVMEENGGSRAGWEPIVAVGANASLPHHRAGESAIGDGLLLLDYGCVVDGYHSDMSRTVWLGGEPSEEASRMYTAVLESQEAGIAAVRPGAIGREVDEACRAVLRSHGMEEFFIHSTGHGVGLDIHEMPRLSRVSDDVLAPGDVVTVEPGVYLPGSGGVRIEDMVLVTETGGEVLTTSPKGLVP